MSGGIAILMALIALGVFAVIGLLLYLTGGAIWWNKANEPAETSDPESRPEHKAPTSPEQEHTHFAGTRRDD